tara:strand:+ start:208 stop:912 length:705 start_codon:yes stop_codon:yes gene_type:complete
MDNNESIIVAEAVHKTYDTGRVRVEALNGINLSVTKGDLIAVMGPSGCGKTTLLNCLSGLDDIDSGSIKIAGEELTQMSDNRKTVYRATRMGYIFQTFNLLPVLTAIENVELPLLVSGTKGKDAREKAMSALELVGLSDRPSHYPSELSGGQQQRIAIARALVNEPEIVWADEPTGNLDSETSSEIVQLMTDLNKKNRQTFIIVTHAQLVADSAQRIIQMSDGEIVDDGIKLMS